MMYLSMFLIAGISISVFLSGLLILKRNKSNADWILVGWFLFIALHLLLFYFDTIDFIDSHPFLAGIILPFPLIHGPFLFLYTAALTGRLTNKWSYNLLHLLPFLGVYLYLSEFFMLPGEQKTFILNNQGIGYELFVQAHFLLIISLGTGYIAASLVLIRKYQRSLLQKFSYTEKINLKWLQYLTWGLGAIWLIVLFGNENHIFLSVVFYIVIIGFFGVKQASIFTEPQLQKEANYHIVDSTEKLTLSSNQPEEHVPKYEKSGLTNDLKLQLKIKLEQLINNEKLFCEPNITLQTVAKKLNVHPNYLSQYINEDLGSTFYDLINRFRVEEFKRLAVKPENAGYNLLSIAYDCGFSSKSSFNRNFKKFTGQTPSQYLKSLKKTSQDL